jgi:hypothetical protein
MFPNGRSVRSYSPGRPRCNAAPFHSTEQRAALLMTNSCHVRLRQAAWLSIAALLSACACGAGLEPAANLVPNPSAEQVNAAGKPAGETNCYSGA